MYVGHSTVIVLSSGVERMTDLLYWLLDGSHLKTWFLACGLIEFHTESLMCIASQPRGNSRFVVVERQPFVSYVGNDFRANVRFIVNQFATQESIRNKTVQWCDTSHCPAAHIVYISTFYEIDTLLHNLCVFIPETCLRWLKFNRVVYEEPDRLSQNWTLMERFRYYQNNVGQHTIIKIHFLLVQQPVWHALLSNIDIHTFGHNTCGKNCTGCWCKNASSVIRS